MPDRSPRVRRSAALLVAAVLMAGCSLGGAEPMGSAGGGDSPNPAIVVIDQPSSNPRPTPEPLAKDIPIPAVSASPAGEPGTGLITVTEGGVVSATADDGTSYTLVIEPGAVAEDVTVEVRPLRGTTGFGEILAGADFAPAGLQLGLPGTLTIELGGGTAPAGLVGLGFSGDVSGTTGRLLAGPGGAPGADVLVFNVSHFSGSVAARVGSSATSLDVGYWQSRGGTSPVDRQAQAETLYAAATLAEREGRISQETADSIRERADGDWLDAEADRLGSEGDLTDFTAVQESIARTVAHERDGEHNSGSQSSRTRTATEKIVRIAESRVKAITDKFATKDVQKAIDSGRISDLGQIHDLLVALLLAQRDLELLGLADEEVTPMLVQLNARLSAALEKSCNDAPVPPSLILSFKRFAALHGDDTTASGDVEALARKCNGNLPIATEKPPMGAFAADGTLTYTWVYDFKDGGNTTHEEYEVTLDLKVRQGQETLIFAKGSRYSAVHKLSGTRVLEGGEIGPIYPGCPTTYSWDGVVGSMLVDGGWDPGSEPAPEAYGWGLDNGGTVELQLGVGEDDWELACPRPFIAIDCPINDAIKGQLVSTQPYEWTFACSNTKEGSTATIRGSLVRPTNGGG